MYFVKLSQGRLNDTKTVHSSDVQCNIEESMGMLINIITKGKCVGPSFGSMKQPRVFPLLHECDAGPSLIHI